MVSTHTFVSSFRLDASALITLAPDADPGSFAQGKKPDPMEHPAASELMTVWLRMIEASEAFLRAPYSTSI
jgi:hypothetical protein